MKKPVKVAITGAAGQIAYSLIFRVASGSLLGPDQPVIMQLLEVPVPEVLEKLKGTVMEVEDCAFPLVHSVEIHSDPMSGFEGTDYALLVGARPRGPGMERKDLLTANGGIFGPQGAALAAKAVRTCGGQSMLKSLPLERLYRDARCGSLMLPWTAELCIDRIGREALYEKGETDD